jgi:uncharacterized membrane protein
MSGAQLLLKKGLLQVGAFSLNISEIGSFFVKAYTNFYIISAVILTVITALTWILALSKAELSHIYPFMALSYVLVALVSWLIFKEDVNALRWAGISIICLGILILSRS